MSSRGKYLRWVCLVGYVSYRIYFLAHGSALVKNEEGEMAGIFICDNSNTLEMTQCTGLDDTTTCDAGIECIRSSCGRPLFPRIGVSYTGSSDPFDSDAATPTQSFVTIMSLLYSLVPYVLILFFVVQLLALGNVVPLTRLGLMGLVALVNDVMLKHILRQPRPTGSCLYFHSYGMPSGHAATSIGLLTFMLLELLLYHPDLFGGRGEKYSSPEECRDMESEGAISSTGVVPIFAEGYGWQRLTAMESNDSEATTEENDTDRTASLVRFDSISGSSELPPEAAVSESASYDIVRTQQWRLRSQSKWSHHYLALLWIGLLLPVPLSRVYLHDHTSMQILIGSMVGMTLGNIWYFCVLRSGFLLLGATNSRKAMECTVKSKFGKWLGLNLGHSGEREQY